MQYYTYKITFKDLPGYFYYGKRKDDGKPYFGSPKTWRRLWLLFEPEVQVLQWYKTAAEVELAEKSIIRATWKDKYSLNENVGGYISTESCRAGRASLLKESMVTGGRKAGEKNGAKNGRLGSKRVLLTRITTGESLEFPSVQEACRVLGLSPGHLCELANGRRKSHKGYTASYL